MANIPIHNASNVLLTNQPGTLPNVSDCLLGWFQPLTFTQISKSISNSQLTETQTPISTMGVRQVFTPQKLAMLPEGQRSWVWFTFYVLPNVSLNNDDIIVFNGVSYRVMSKTDYTEYGYRSFDCVQDYTP